MVSSLRRYKRAPSAPKVDTAVSQIVPATSASVSPSKNCGTEVKEAAEGIPGRGGDLQSLFERSLAGGYLPRRRSVKRPVATAAATQTTADRHGVGGRNATAEVGEQEEGNGDRRQSGHQADQSSGEGGGYRRDGHDDRPDGSKWMKFGVGEADHDDPGAFRTTAQHSTAHVNDPRLGRRPATAPGAIGAWFAAKCHHPQAIKSEAGGQARPARCNGRVAALLVVGRVFVLASPSCERRAGLRERLGAAAAPDTPPSSSGLGHRPFKATAGIRIPLGASFHGGPGRIAQWESTCLTSRGSQVQILLRPLGRRGSRAAQPSSIDFQSRLPEARDVR